MAGCKHFGWLSGLLAILLLMPVSGATAERLPTRDLPLPVRVVLAKVGPMIQAEKYQGAIDLILNFQARGGSATEPGQADPKGYHHPELYVALGNCHFMLEQYAPAAAAYRRALAGDAAHTIAWLNLSRAYYEMDQFAESGRCFGQAYDTAEKKNPAHLYFSAVAYLMADDHRQAIDIFERLFTLHPSAIQPEWKEHLVHALLATDQPRRALPYIRELAQVYTGDKQIQWQEILLYQYVHLEMHKEALALAHRLTRENPTLAKWWKALAHIQLNAGRQQEALMALTIYGYLTPLSMDEKKLLADLELQSGIPVKAVALYKAYLEEKPQKDVLYHLALAYQQMGRLEEALAAINEFGPQRDDADIILIKGELHYYLNQFDQAAAAYKQAAQIKGRHVGRAWLMAGYAAWQMDDLAASQAAFAKAAKDAQQRKAANKALKQLAQLTLTHAKKIN